MSTEASRQSESADLDECTSIGVDGIERKPELRAHDQPFMCALVLEKVRIFHQANGRRFHLTRTVSWLGSQVTTQKVNRVRGVGS